MHRLFGKSKPKVEAPTLDDAAGGISKRVADIDAKISGLDNELRKYKEQLKKASGATAQNLKKRAMDVLKRKRMYEQQKDQLCNQQFSIDQTSFAIETVRNTQTTVAAMKAAATTLKKENKKLSLAEIEDMQDEMEDMLEDVGEISEILSRSYGMPDGIEEEDLDAELACLEDELASEELDMEESTSVSASSAPVVAAPASQPAYLKSMPSQPTQLPTVFPQTEAKGYAAASAAPAPSAYNSLV